MSKKNQPKAKKKPLERKFGKNNVDLDMNKAIDEEMAKIEEKLGIEIDVCLEMDTQGIYPVIKYLKK